MEEEDKKSLTEEELLQKEAQLKEKEEALEKKEKELNLLDAAVTGAKYNLYDRINVNLKTLDIFIGFVVVALIVAIVMSVVLK